jgi:hypothetical protein
VAANKFGQSGAAEMLFPLSTKSHRLLLSLLKQPSIVSIDFNSNLKSVCKLRWKVSTSAILTQDRLCYLFSPEFNEERVQILTASIKAGLSSLFQLMKRVSRQQAHWLQ